jgi:MFS family permease
VNELGQEHPGAFGPNDGKSRALAIVGVAWTLGNFVGPVLAGVLNERVDYYAMNCVLGEYGQALLRANFGPINYFERYLEKC